VGASEPTTEIAVPKVPAPAADPANSEAPAQSDASATENTALSSSAAASSDAPESSQAQAIATEVAPPIADKNEETYAIDPVHSNVGFRVKHLFSNVTGRFNDFSGTLQGDPAKPEEAKVNVEIRVASIDTKDAKRDLHLRSDEFFDVEKFPTIQFVSKKVHRTGQDTAFVTGDLTMRGITKEVILQTKFLGRGKGMTGRIHTGWEAQTALKRSDFGLTWNKAIEGTQLVGDDIQIDLQIEAIEPQNEVTAPAAAPKPPERVLPEQDGVVPPNQGTSEGAAGQSAPSAPTSPTAPDISTSETSTPSTPATPQTPPAPQAPAPETPAPAPTGEQAI
jgi:polyisoprenoid-binding protein YceI